MNRKPLTFLAGVVFVTLFGPSLARAEDHLAAAIGHTKDAIENGRQGHADALVNHAKAALQQAEAAEEEKDNSEIKRGITYLRVALFRGKLAHSDLPTAVKLAEKALTRLRSAEQSKPADVNGAPNVAAGPTKSCPFGDSYADGCSGAQATGTKIPNFFTGYAGKTYSVRPPWNVAGVDYPVGLPSEIRLVDPSTAPLPIGCSYSQAKTQTVTCEGANITVSGYDFSLHNGIRLMISGANNIVTKNKFKLNPNCDDPVVNYFLNAPGRFTFTYNSVEGGGSACDKLLYGTMLNGIYVGGSSSLVEYNLFRNIPSDVMDAGGPKDSGQASYTLRYNLYLTEGFQGHPDTTQFNGGNFISIVIEFNTFYNQPPASTQVFHVEAQLTSELRNSVVAHNSIVTVGNCKSANECSANYDIACKQDSGPNINANFSAYGNYIDWSGAYGALANYACQSATWGTPLANVDLTTGAALTAP
jgi:hypothetical protein